jgi:WD40 repeat protein
VKIWDANLGVEAKTLRGHTMQTNNVAYSYDGKFIASCSDDRTVMIWSTDLTKKDPIMTLTGHTAPVLTALYSFDSKYLATADERGVVKIWSMPSGELVRSMNAHTDLVQDVAFAEDNKTLVTGSLDKSVKMWDLTTGQNVMTQNVGTEVWSLDVTSNAGIIILGCADGSVRVLKEAGSEAGRTNRGGR